MGFPAANTSLKMSGKKKSQAWSFDVILAVIIFVGAFFICYFLLKPQTENTVDVLRDDAEFIAREILSEASPINVVENGVINETKLEQLVGNYSKLKSRVRVLNDFCIYLEDQRGNVVYLKSGGAGVGSPKINISGVPCK